MMMAEHQQMRHCKQLRQTSRQIPHVLHLQIWNKLRRCEVEHNYGKSSNVCLPVTTIALTKKLATKECHAMSREWVSLH